MSVNNLIVVTSGQAFFDIDTLACGVAYKELLEKSGYQAVVFLPGHPTASITKMVKSLGENYTTICPEKVSGFAIVDVSNPEKIAKEVSLEKVIEIFDHHPGWEKFWQEKLGDKAHIEMIGACATLIWEAYVRVGKEKEISSCAASLLSIAIVSNTLDFNLPITSPRDHAAFAALAPYTSLPDNWKEKYYQEQEEEIFNNLEAAFLSDTKVEKLPGLETPLTMGQLELRDPRRLLAERRKELEKFAASLGNNYWMINLPSLVEKKSYFLIDHPELEKIFSQKFGLVFNHGVAETNKLFLRKMIIEAFIK